jgi:hypothetical protein
VIGGERTVGVSGGAIFPLSSAESRMVVQREVGLIPIWFLPTPDLWLVLGEVKAPAQG